MKRYILNAIFILIATIQHVYSSEQLEWDSVSDQQVVPTTQEESTPDQEIGDLLNSASEAQNAVVEEAAPAVQEESRVDREIGEFFKGQTFGKLSLNYSWEGESYSVHFVHNPMREALFCDGLAKPVRWPLAMTIDPLS